MTPAARIAAAIGILDAILDGAAAEQALTGWARASRFAGSKDRAAIRDHVFQALRCRRSYACLGGAETGRGVMIGALRAAGQAPEEIFTGDGYAPPPLTDRERGAGRCPETDAEAVDLPDWQVPKFEAALGVGWRAAAAALQARAPVMLRVNRRSSNVSQVIDLLAKDGIEATPAGIADTALVVTAGARRVQHSAPYRDGLVELQDGSSQAAMAGLPIPDGADVLDYCAGGGGKTLALAARAEARWFAHDADAGRMKDLAARATRAGCRVTALPADKVATQAPYDVVLCDVPCSGSGTWRRTPDAKWRLTPDRLKALLQVQAGILDDAAPLVAPDGVLAYATCSVFHEENEARVEAFVATSKAWKIADCRRWPISAEGDGFFLALLRRK